MDALKCPRCRRYDVIFDGFFYRCLWKDCHWKTKEYKDPGMTEKEKRAANRLLVALRIAKNKD